ncbi:hypothetical protein KMP13_10870 [Epibacterium ulvae]|uniref:hypothetical protein n=1 Tax=Epibacterium ulvae TaxID=1156985 RepID=UPI001BFC238C|nr:hypothetical protein [Epibacterium ulvae]MBT8154391.1 hypothetical protein [Epibacterium ulvae]
MAARHLQMTMNAAMEAETAVEVIAAAAAAAAAAEAGADACAVQYVFVHCNAVYSTCRA